MKKMFLHALSTELLELFCFTPDKKVISIVLDRRVHSRQLAIENILKDEKDRVLVNTCTKFQLI